jgi:hypothetical protein
MSIITVSEIELLFKLVVRKLKDDRINEIQINMDKYWIVLSDEWNDFEKTPEPAVGSLLEDAALLKNAIEDNAIHSYSELDRLSSILRYISEVQAPS